MSKLPPEKLTAHERWELADFGDSRPSAIAEQAAQHTAATMQQLREVAKLKEEAQVAGRAEGYEEGHAKGLEDGRIAAAKQLAQLTDMALEFQKSADQVRETASADILELALDISKAMIGAALQTRPELIITIINKCVRSLPFNNGIGISVHPTDAPLVMTAFARQLEENGWFITEDDSISPGGCKLDTAKNHIDASIEQRWSSIARELNSDTHWIINDAK
jgi:flagellar assembly protein FliH